MNANVKRSLSSVGFSLPRVRGFTLIELLIAMALGVLLLLGLVQVFGGVRAAFSASEGLARVQENSRFAMEFLRFDTRMAGHYGCRSEYQVIELPSRAGRGFYNQTLTTAASATVDDRTLTDLDSAPYALRLHRPVQVYDYVAGGGTSPGNTLAAALASFPGGITAANNFVPALPTELTTTGLGLGTNGLLGGQVGDPVPGSDIIMLRYLNEDPVTLTGGLSNGSLLGAAAADFPQFRVFGATDCSALSLFQITSAAAPVQAIPAGTANLNRRAWQYLFGVFVPTYQYEVALYYVGRTGNATPPALFRRRLMQNPTLAAEGAFFSEPEELVSGVEMMQVLLGVDNESEGASPTPIDDTVNLFRSASQHLPSTAGLTVQQLFDRERSIKSLRVSLLVRSPEIASSTAPAIATRIVGDVRVTPPADFRLRHVYDSTISVRNRIKN